MCTFRKRGLAQIKLDIDHLQDFARMHLKNGRCGFLGGLFWFAAIMTFASRSRSYRQQNVMSSLKRRRVGNIVWGDSVVDSLLREVVHSATTRCMEAAET